MGPTHFFEESTRICGFRLIAGLDEAGRGPLAGPVVAAAVILPRRCSFKGLRDSKLLTESQREKLYDDIGSRALGWSVGLATEKEIDRLNILGATRVAFSRAIEGLSPQPDFLLLDAMRLSRVPISQQAIIKGDRLSVSIAAASVIAKVSRDRLMLKYHDRYPQYQFHIHKGYPTPEHLKLLAHFGPCEGHRQSFRPVRACKGSSMA
ncbi:MAG: ribonuclease HII [Nitrospirota bacterium]|nr:MAG: ribonuclease HII [Nitrospirota bacterium]